MAIRKPDKEKRPRVLLVPPPDLPVPAVQGGAVETLLTHLIRENEKQGLLELLCASVPDDAARRAATPRCRGLAAYQNALCPPPQRAPPVLADGLCRALHGHCGPL